MGSDLVSTWCTTRCGRGTAVCSTRKPQYWSESPENAIVLPDSATSCATMAVFIGVTTPRKGRRLLVRSSKVMGLASTARTSPLKAMSCAKRMEAPPMLAPASRMETGRLMGM